VGKLQTVQFVFLPAGETEADPDGRRRGGKRKEMMFFTKSIWRNYTSANLLRVF